MELPGISAMSPVTAGSDKLTARELRLQDAAVQLEASFLSEMLKYAGVGKVSDSFGGGAGEEQFASMLRDAQATEIASTGGIGLAESIFEALKERIDD